MFNKVCYAGSSQWLCSEIKSRSLPVTGEGRRTPSQRKMYALLLGRKWKSREFFLPLLPFSCPQLKIICQKFARVTYFGTAYSDPLQSHNAIITINMTPYHFLYWNWSFLSVKWKKKLSLGDHQCSSQVSNFIRRHTFHHLSYMIFTFIETVTS